MACLMTDTSVVNLLHVPNSFACALAVKTLLTLLNGQLLNFGFEQTRAIAARESRS